MQDPHNYYRKDIGWIRDQTEKGVRLLASDIPLYSGLFVPQLSPDGLAQAFDASIAGGARGVSLFSASAMTDEHWRSFSQRVKS